MSDVDLAKSERAAICALLDQVGPDQPTLCEGWTTRDLTAHLVVREARPDASAGILVKPLEFWTEKVQNDAAKKPFGYLVGQVRNGPPTLSFFALPGIDALANSMEYLIHHEDVRRGQPDWAPRELDEATRDEVWKRLRGSKRMLFRNATVPVALDPTDVAHGHPVEAPPHGVVLRGPVVELALHAHGRSAVVGLVVDGDDAAVAKYEETRLGV
jgi:uncharacterized protein (TIGR03085 family)